MSKPELKTYQIEYGFCAFGGRHRVHAASEAEARTEFEQKYPSDYYEGITVTEVRNAEETAADRKKFRKAKTV